MSYSSYLFRLHWCESVSILGYTRAIERDTIIVNKLYSQFNSSDYTGVGVRTFVDTREQSVWSDCTCARVSVDRHYVQFLQTASLPTDDTSLPIKSYKFTVHWRYCKGINKHDHSLYLQKFMQVCETNQSVNVIPHSNQTRPPQIPSLCVLDRIVAVESALTLANLHFSSSTMHASCTLQLYIAGACHEFSDSQADQCCWMSSLDWVKLTRLLITTRIWLWESGDLSYSLEQVCYPH